MGNYNLPTRTAHGSRPRMKKQTQIPHPARRKTIQNEANSNTERRIMQNEPNSIHQPGCTLHLLRNKFLVVAERLGGTIIVVAVDKGHVIPYSPVIVARCAIAGTFVKEMVR